MVFMVTGICVIGIWWMHSYTRHGEGVDVPNVKGKLISDAQYELDEMGLEGVVIDSIYDKRLKPGMVVEQTPGFGSRVKVGREIFLKVNAKGEPTLPLPKIIGNCSLHEAEANLRALGFKIGPYEYVDGDKDLVLGVKLRGRNVATGDRVPLTTPITLVVGNNEIERDENEMVYGDNWGSENEEDDEDTDDKEELVF